MPAPRPSVAYEGRPLSRPGEEVVDQGLAFDLATLVSRRQALRALGLGAVAAGVAACGGEPAPAGPSAGTSGAGVTPGLAEIPDETAGPFPGNDLLRESGVVRRDIRRSIGTAGGTAEGVPMTLRLVVRDLARGGVPYEGVAVYVWHCDREGRYSLYSDGVRGENYLRGVQVAGADGTVTFTSVVPGCYPGRWPHVHLEVYPDVASIADGATVVATSQVALPQDVCEAVYATEGYGASADFLEELSLATDGVFADDRGGLQLATATGDPGGGYTVALPVGIDRRTPARPRG